jgi:hypothetical protein
MRVVKDPRVDRELAAWASRNPYALLPGVILRMLAFALVSICDSDLPE